MFHDLFSDHAKDYKLYRPTYPTELFNYLSSLVDDHQSVWDCGTGNGQAAISLATIFKTVYATDPSKQQIDQATQKPNIIYQVACAESSTLANQSVSMITVFQAFHWFDAPAFFDQVKRILKPGGILAIVGYHTALTGIAGVDSLYRWFNREFLWEKGCWEMPRDSLNNNYQNTQLPMQTLTTPEFSSTCHWTLQDYLAYLNTWSSVKTYENKYHENPVQTHIQPQIQHLWPNPTLPRTISFPLVLKVGRSALR
jgi:ubiquinone/menaquinone biosynthesis C-methylase UbiE